MIYGSVCSGIEAASVAWKPLGWRAAFLSEIDAGARAVLQYRFPDVPLHGDFTTIKAGDYEPIDLLVGGTPCQDFSIAGLRAGLDGARGNLTLEYLRLAQRLRPRWVVWENVPGVLSIDGGRAFGTFLGGLAKLGYGWAYRILDAQHFGVPQRRRRVFVVGHLGDRRPPAAVLFERESLRGDPPPRRGAGAGVAALAARGVGTCGADDDDQAHAGHMIETNTGDVAACLTAHGGRLDLDTETFVAHTLRADGFDASEDGTGRGVPLIPVVLPLQEIGKRTGVSATDPGVGIGIGADGDPMFTLQAGARHGVAIAFRTAGDGGVYEEGEATAPLTTGTDRAAQLVAYSVALRGREGGATAELGDDVAGCLRASGGGGDKPYVLTSAVRRLTPREAERLQGFPDDWTLVPHRGKPAADGPRYKQAGNAMNVAVMRWLGRRIAAVEAILGDGRRAAA